MGHESVVRILLYLMWALRLQNAEFCLLIRDKIGWFHLSNAIILFDDNLMVIKFFVRRVSRCLVDAHIMTICIKHVPNVFEYFLFYGETYL